MRLSEKAYHLIKEKIVTLELEPLAVIDEKTLGEELDLGRTPIREALQRLEVEGLIFAAPRRGKFVADISITDLQKIFEMRMILEGFCARLAAHRATEEQLGRMEAVTENVSQVPEGDREKLMEIDERFHELLYEAAGNEFLAETLQRLHALSFRLWYLSLDRLGSVKGAMEQHVEITRALKERDADRAEALLLQHIAEFQQKIKAVL
jgi:DNA-binding GntR family transcriptional regulator